MFVVGMTHPGVAIDTGPLCGVQYGVKKKVGAIYVICVPTCELVRT
jgi:hypothetical protein